MALNDRIHGHALTCTDTAATRATCANIVRNRGVKTHNKSTEKCQHNNGVEDVTKHVSNGKHGDESCLEQNQYAETTTAGTYLDATHQHQCITGRSLDSPVHNRHQISADSDKRDKDLYITLTSSVIHSLNPHALKSRPKFRRYDNVN
ncbi:hypothetical protein DPMN_109716 [Dreissena polymorpha]|uniref:Uncharacterized protein n=1 Tax=Dreissena polymorpha TaxID=45954 RepID=A0A9D4KB32_DREPO|nr:hypothetical protein DPMN_109716 [Dreissena polymorpha]